MQLASSKGQQCLCVQWWSSDPEVLHAHPASQGFLIPTRASCANAHEAVATTEQINQRGNNGTGTATRGT